MPVFAIVPDGAVSPRYGITRDGLPLSYVDLIADLPRALWPLPGSDTFGVRANAEAAATALALRQTREEVAV